MTPGKILIRLAVTFICCFEITLHIFGVLHGFGWAVLSFICALIAMRANCSSEDLEVREEKQSGMQDPADE